ncbi:MAG: plastocyanin/azurin family copper-binding protein [Acidimicrobiales bacterium]
MKRHARHLLLIAPVTVVMVAGCGSVDDDAAADASGRDEDATVVVETFSFEPDPLVVDAGTVISFVNNDKIDHSVTSGTRDEPTPELFDGALPEQGSTFELTLDEPGTYEYFCQIHPGPGMTASITVR